MKAVPAANDSTDEAAPASSARPSGFFKKCGCGISYSRSAWEHLPYVGWMRGRREAIELRQCSCDSTIAVRIAV